MEVKISNRWKQKIMGWARDLILVFSMWCIWLTDVYMIECLQQWVVRVFLIAIIVIIILIREYQDATIYQLEQELKNIKNRS